MEELIGYLKNIKYKNTNNNYTIATLKLDQKKDETITVVGYFNVPSKDQLVKFIGDYADNPRYGKQFQVDSFELILPNSKTSIVRFLSSSLFYGVGEKCANKIYDALGDEALTKISSNPYVLEEIDISEKNKEAVISGILKNQNLNEAIKIFVGHGISMKNLLKMDAIYHDKLIDIVMNDPYILIKDIDGLGFKTVDKMALSLGFSEDDQKRIRSLVLYSLKNLCYKTLDTYTSKFNLFNESKTILKTLDNEQFDKAFEDLKRSFDIIEDSNGRVYYKDLYDSELGIANLIRPYLENNESISKSIIDENIKRVEAEDGIKYSDEQVDTIYNVLNHNLSIITGGPGTGKTTVLNAIIKIYLRLFPNTKVSLVAPTGRASKRMSELSGFPSSTIHRFLKWDMETCKFSYNASNPIYGTFLIVDEFSMVDSQLFYNLLLATQNYKKILLIGDDKQLEPLSPGNTLKDLLDFHLISRNTLTINHRQSNDSGIIPMCVDSNMGILNEENLNKKDVKFIEVSSFDIRETILNTAKDFINKGYSQNQIQILCPMYDGVAGINSINNLVREYFNPKQLFKKEYQIGTVLYREGDKILQLKNQPDDNVFNGDIGILETVDKGDLDNVILYVNFDGSLVRYTSSEFANITHAYAISVHKSQGSEFDCVIIVCSSEHQIMLRRKLIYTGLSRAKKQLVLIGNKKAYIKGINTIDKKIRKTTLNERLVRLFNPTTQNN